MEQRTESRQVVSYQWTPGRVAEKQNASLNESLTPRVYILAMGILLGSALDTGWTLWYVQQGLQEANPLMALVLTYGPLAFASIKMGLTGVGTGILVAYQGNMFAWKALYSLLIVYALLVGCHMVFFVAYFA